VTDSPPPAPAAARGRLVRRLLRGAGLAVVALLVLLVSGLLPLQAIRVPSDSMTPTITAGDHLLLDRRHADTVAVGDVVVLRDPIGGADGGELIAKRVIAVGGDSVGFEDGVLVRNGRPVTEPYTHDFLDGVYYGPDVVPPGTVYVLGDNRRDSVDSRQFGPVPLSSVVGRVTARLFPSPGAL
jgi:signal peptidase I